MIVPPPVDLPRLMLVMVSRDYGLFGWAVVFFKESVTRDATAGMRTAFTLRYELMSI